MYTLQSYAYVSNIQHGIVFQTNKEEIENNSGLLLPENRNTRDGAVIVHFLIGRYDG